MTDWTIAKRAFANEFLAILHGFVAVPAGIVVAIASFDVLPNGWSLLLGFIASLTVWVLFAVAMLHRTTTYLVGILGTAIATGIGALLFGGLTQDYASFVCWAAALAGGLVYDGLAVATYRNHSVLAPAKRNPFLEEFAS